jgi:Mrp family chromosome partitioning ATPase
VLLSTQTDATLVVTRSGRTRDYELESAMDALRNVGAKVIGTVLNGFHISKAYGYRYKYAYRYGRDYAYGYGQKKD